MENGIYKIQGNKGLKVEDGKALAVRFGIDGWSNDYAGCSKKFGVLTEQQISFLEKIGLAEDQTYVEFVR